MTTGETPSFDTKEDIEFEKIRHDHGTLRDGPCYGCEALTLGGQSVPCDDCNGTGEPLREGDIDCYGCGGNFNVVIAPVGTRESIDQVA